MNKYIDKAMTQWFDSWWYKILADQSEFFGIILAFIIAYTTFLVERKRKRDADTKRNKEEEEQRNARIKTARYWIFYSAANRVRQDSLALRHLQSIVNREEFKKYARIGVGNTIDLEEPDVEPKELTLIRKELQAILSGFKDTWSNDDSLMQKIVFDFALLSNDEQEDTLKYFSRYSALEDRVSFVLPYLTNREKQGGLDAGEFCSRAYEIYARIYESLFLGNRILQIVIIKGEIKGLNGRVNEAHQMMTDSAEYCLLPENLGQHPEEPGRKISIEDIWVDPRAFNWIIRAQREQSFDFLQADLKWEGNMDANGNLSYASTLTGVVGPDAPSPKHARVTPP